MLINADLHSNIQRRALMEICKTAKFDNSLNNLSSDIVSTDCCPVEEKERIRKAIDLYFHADLKKNKKTPKQ